MTFGNGRDERISIRELLPFYLNGTLQPVERARVERAVAKDSALLAELQELRALYASIKAIEPDTADEGTEERLRRMMERIDCLDRVTEPDK